MAYTVGSLFSGIGGLDLAAHWAGFETKWFVEKEPFCQKVLAKHWPNTPIHGDIFECKNLEHVTLLHGGFPCQPYSIAGLQLGEEDERYLLPQMLRVIGEVKPYAVLFENVPGFPQLNDGNGFKDLLRTLTEMGFDAEWGHIRASDSGAPHKRERWFCVAYSKSREYAGNPGTVGRETKEAGQQNVWPVFSGSSSNVGNTDSKRLEGQWAGRKPIMGTRHRKAQLKSASHGSRQSRPTQSRLGGNNDGLPRWMDFPGWPARPGEDQHAYEPSRVTSAKTPDRAARLKALGNAVVPQVAFPLFAAIHEWLTAQDAERVA